MGLEETSPHLLYGFHGGATAKAQELRRVFQRADQDGKMSTGERNYYLVDLVLETPSSFDDSILLGQLQHDMLNKVPFLVVKRVTRQCVEVLAELWFEWAKEMYGERKVLRADVDWEDVKSFIPAFPNAAEKLFEKFTHLRCAVIPVYARDEKDRRLITWVGVMPREKAARWISSSEVRMQPDVKANLKFGK